MPNTSREIEAPTSEQKAFIIGLDEPVLITGAGGFIGRRVLEFVLRYGFRHVRCLVRSAAGSTHLKSIADSYPAARVEMIEGNLLSRDDCTRAAQGVKVVYHLAAGRGEKSYPDAFLNSVVTTRNLLDACVQAGTIQRFVNISSFSVYSRERKRRGTLDESCPIEAKPATRGEAYCFAKVKQDEIVMQYQREQGLRSVIVRPGYVYGPGNEAIPGRVGIGSFGVFLHLGGSNRLPLTYVDNCAEAIALAGIAPGIDGEVFNIVDDELPTSRKFLRLYKKDVKRFASLYVPGFASWFLCFLWEKYSEWSQGQLVPVYNRPRWHAYWKKSRYSNAKFKSRTGWSPRVPLNEGLNRYFAACRTVRHHA